MTMWGFISDATMLVWVRDIILFHPLDENGVSLKHSITFIDGQTQNVKMETSVRSSHRIIFWDSNLTE